jgi:hypothetical protein
MPRPKDRPSPLPWLAGAAAVVALLAGGFGPGYGAAVGTLDAMQKADVAGLQRHIDFVALRDDVSTDLRTAFDAEMKRQGLDETGIAVARNFVSAPINALVDRIATPDGMAQLLQATPANDRKIYSAQALLSGVFANGSWKGLDALEVAIPDGNKKREELVRLEFRRVGLIDWKMVGVTYPTNALSAAAGLPPAAPK